MNVEWSPVISGAGLIISVLGILASFLIARHYGDLAAFRAAKKHEEEKDVERREKVLTALRTQVQALPRINEGNQSALGADHLLPMPYPVLPFEMAVFSDGAIPLSDETIQTVSDYLLKARQLNALIESLHKDHLTRRYGQAAPSQLGDTRRFMRDQLAADMPNLIKDLQTRIEAELGADPRQI
ncbi:MAG: hypothetical protein H8D77_02365 [Chloroflexi bacterium]|nr:hypothetical protein [Chloroflexota bacterium]